MLATIVSFPGRLSRAKKAGFLCPGGRKGVLETPNLRERLAVGRTAAVPRAQGSQAASLESQEAMRRRRPISRAD